MAIGYMTDSTMMGTMLGGNLTGAMIGDMLNNSDEHSKHDNFGGGGSTGDWTPDNIPVDTTHDYNNIDNPVSDSTQTNVPDPDTFS
jgi:hypothetical protein